MSRTPTRRIESLDGLRGVAALVVAVMFHYRHFFDYGNQPTPAWFDNPLFRPVLSHGYLAVDLFFTISGFIFAHIYYDPISRGRVTAGQFFALRFARLYPVHLVMTLAVGIAAWTGLLAFGSTPLPYIAASDAYHLLLNLLMLERLNLQTDHSFNFVSWSLTQEAICYCVFFCLVRFTKTFELCCAALAVFGVYLLFNRIDTVLLMSDLGRGLFGFFAGCLIARAMRAGFGTPIGVAAGVLLAMAVLQRYLPLMPKGTKAVWGVSGDSMTLTTVVLPAITILSLTFPPLRWGLSTWLFRKLGERSYSIYMVHIFVQCVLILVARTLGAAIPYDRPWFYGAYLAAVLVAAETSLRVVERPANRWLRRKYAGAGRQAAIDASGVIRNPAQAFADRPASPALAMDQG